jgi:hypothetical protein
MRCMRCDGEVGDSVGSDDCLCQDCWERQASRLWWTMFTEAASEASSDVVVLAVDAVVGTWYLHSEYGRVLACGTTGGDWLPAFAVRLDDGRTVMKYFSEEDRLVLCIRQEW